PSYRARQTQRRNTACRGQAAKQKLCRKSARTCCTTRARSSEQLYRNQTDTTRTNRSTTSIRLASMLKKGNLYQGLPFLFHQQSASSTARQAYRRIPQQFQKRSGALLL